MNYGAKILTRLKAEKKELLGPSQKNKFSLLNHKEGGLLFQVKYKDLDKYGIVLDYLSISKDEQIRDAEIINKKLAEQAEALQKTVTYLLEDFRLLELDKMNKRAQLRSYPPHEKKNSKFYYEIMLDEGIRIHFQRYEYVRDQKRYVKITSQLTLETFERLVDDLSSLLN